MTSCEAALVFWTESGPCCWPFIYYYTSRRVGEGEELLMNYGDDYWKLLVEEHRNGRSAAPMIVTVDKSMLMRGLPSCLFCIVHQECCCIC